jgi:hypothetical protein
MSVTSELVLRSTRSGRAFGKNVIILRRVFAKPSLSPALAHEFMLNYAATMGGELSTNDMVDRLRRLLQDTHEARRSRRA